MTQKVLSSFPLMQTQVYILNARNKLKLTLNQELVVVFQHAKKDVLGLLVYPERHVERGLFDSLETLLNQLKKTLSVASDEMQAKIFGVAYPAAGLVERVSNWIKTQGVLVKCIETGKRVSRTLYLEGGKEEVAVSYAESLPQGFYQFISTQSSQRRHTKTQKQISALVLSENHVTGTLIKQSLEEHDGFSVVLRSQSKESPLEGLKDFEIVVLDIESLDFSKWKGVLSKIESSKFGFKKIAVGETPKGVKLSLQTWSFLPRVEPKSVLKFKSTLKTMLEPYTESSTVLKFISKRKK